MPAPEARHDVEESNRMWASASFVGVLIIIGVPLWWKTTEVSRVALPYHKIVEFDELPHYITTNLKVVANDHATASELADLVQKTFEGYELLNVNIEKVVMSNQLHHTLSSVADEHEAVEEVGAAYDLTDHNSILVVQRTPLFQDTWLARERVLFFRDSKAAQTVVRVLRSVIYQTEPLRGARAVYADEHRRTRFPPADAYDIVLSVVQPRPDFMSITFDAAQAMDDYIGPFVDDLSILHNFTLKSQFLYLLDFDFQTREVKDTSDYGRHFAVRRDRLHRLLSRLEEMAPAGSRPALSFALYAAPCDNAPLRIYDEDERPIASSIQAFMSPKWGGVVLDAPSAAECKKLVPDYRPVTRLVMGTFIRHLRQLLGIVEPEPLPGAFLEPLRSTQPRRWEIDALLRLRTLEQITSAERTLHSLSRLLVEISNIVIDEDVGAAVNLAADSIKEATQLMADGQLVEAHKHAQTAHRAAEMAFMDPSLLALLYFPDDQKYAIYIPLFLPIMFPVVLSMKNLLRWMRGKKIREEPPRE